MNIEVPCILHQDLRNQHVETGERACDHIETFPRLHPFPSVTELDCFKSWTMSKPTRCIIRCIIHTATPCHEHSSDALRKYTYPLSSIFGKFLVPFRQYNISYRSQGRAFHIPSPRPDRSVQTRVAPRRGGLL